VAKKAQKKNCSVERQAFLWAVFQTQVEFLSGRTRGFTRDKLVLRKERPPNLGFQKLSLLSESRKIEAGKLGPSVICINGFCEV